MRSVAQEFEEVYMKMLARFSEDCPGQLSQEEVEGIREINRVKRNTAVLDIISQNQALFAGDDNQICMALVFWGLNILYLVKQRDNFDRTKLRAALEKSLEKSKGFYMENARLLFEIFKSTIG